MDKKRAWAPKNNKGRNSALVKDVALRSLWNTDRKELMERFAVLAKQKELKRAKLQERVNIMKELREKNFTLKEIGAEFGITHERVRQLLKKDESLGK